MDGKYNTRGPTMGDFSHWFFETIDIAGELCTGENTIAAEIVNWGPKRSFTFFSQMTSFMRHEKSTEQ